MKEVKQIPNYSTVTKVYKFKDYDGNKKLFFTVNWKK